MKKLDARSFSVGVLVILGLAIFLSAAAAPPRAQSAQVRSATSEIVLTFDPAQCKVHWTLDSTLHQVHGTFVLKSGILHFNPETGKAGGEIVVLATSGESGNGSRDERMHKEILETAKFPDMIFRPTEIQGTVASPGASDVQLHGVFSIHGAEHELAAPVHAELTGDHWKGTTRFEVPYVTWGIKNPSNFFLKVKRVVNVELQMSGEVKLTNALP